jgi:c-di-GMP-specific phosphodiesterase
MSEGWIWDAVSTLAALGAGEAAVWSWSPAEDRLRLAGSIRALGLSPLAPECASAGFRALVSPQHRHMAEDLLAPQPAGTEVAVRLTLPGGEPCVWRGRWLEDGRCAGVAAAEARMAAGERDRLTGLLDRSSFIQAARERLQEPVPQRLILADLVRLRRLNEALGHERADLVLAAVGSRLAAALPPRTLVARIGEDEFAAMTPAGDAAPDLEAVRRELERPLRVAGLELHPRVTLGQVEAQGGADAPEMMELLRRAEVEVEVRKAPRTTTAMAGAKRDGLSRLALESDLQGAIGRGELAPFYQPIVRLAGGELAGFEALARWRHPRLGLLTPEHFLPLCEELGLMSELGSMMRRESAVQLSAWRGRRAAAADLTVAVNLSVGELERPELLAEATALRREADLPPGALKLEVTESEVMRDPERAAIILHQLRAAGLTLALDDFGVGFSSLSYLTRLPIDTLKIDGWFVRTMAEDTGSAKIVSSIVRLGRDLAMEVVAEGVEDADTARRLLALGCDYAQGFGFAQPMTPEHALDFIGGADLPAAGLRALRG